MGDNSIPVGLSVWPHPRLGGLADSLSLSPPSVPPASQVAQAPVVISVYEENPSKLGSISAAAPFRGPARPGSREKPRPSPSSPFPSPHRPERSDGDDPQASRTPGRGLGLGGGGRSLRGPVGSALSTRWGARPVVMVGGVLTSLGFVFSAFARSLLHLYLGLGLLAGCGWALVFAPALGTLSRYFSRRRVLAVGLALTGNGASSLLLAPALQLLLDTLGWRGALLLLGAVTLHLTPCGALLRPLALPGDPAAPPRNPLAALGLGLFKRRAFSVFALGTALIGGGYFVPYVHLAPHALDRGLGGYGAALVVAVAAVGDAGARLVCGWLADQGWVPLPRLLAVFGALTGLGLLAVGLVPAVGSEDDWGGALLAASGAYGLSAGSYAPLVFGVLPGLVGIGGVVQATGLVMMLMSLGGLLGPPLSGFLRDETGDFTASFLVCGSFILSGSFIYMGLPRALPSCRPASPPATLPPEMGELLQVPQVALLPPRGPHSTLDTAC